MYEVGISIDEFETFGEASFAEKFAFEISADTEFTTRLLELFFNNRLWLNCGSLI